MSVWVCKKFAKKLEEYNSKSGNERECIFRDETGTMLCDAEHPPIDFMVCQPCDAVEYRPVVKHKRIYNNSDDTTRCGGCNGIVKQWDAYCAKCGGALMEEKG